MRRLALRVERRRLLSVMIALTFCLSAVLGLLVTPSSDMSGSAVRGGPTGEIPTIVRTQAMTSHAPIFIDGNAGFTNASGVVWGSGTSSDPYIIENWDIDASTADGIEMWNVDAYFIIRNCNLHDGYDYRGIHLFFCINGILDNNTCSNNYYGMLLESSNG